MNLPHTDSEYIKAVPGGWPPPNNQSSSGALPSDVVQERSGAVADVTQHVLITQWRLGLSLLYLNRFLILVIGRIQCCRLLLFVVAIAHANDCKARSADEIRGTMHFHTSDPRNELTI